MFSEHAVNTVCCTVKGEGLTIGSVCYSRGVARRDGGVLWFCELLHEGVLCVFLELNVV